MLKLNIYKNQREIEKTFTAETYDIMYGTVEDIFEVLDGVTGKATNDEILKVITANRDKLNRLLLDIFPEATAEDLRKVKVKELIPLFLSLFSYVRESFGAGKN